MAALRSRRGHYILQLWFLSFFFFPRLFSAVGHWTSTISTHDVAIVRIYNAGLKCAARGSPKIQHANITQNCRLRTVAQICRAISSKLKHVSTIGKNTLNSNISSASSYNMVNFVPLTAAIGWGVRGTRANFNGFLTSWLHYCTNVAEWKSTRLRTMFSRLLRWYTSLHFRELLSPNGILPGVKFTLL